MKLIHNQKFCFHDTLPFSNGRDLSNKQNQKMSQQHEFSQHQLQQIFGNPQLSLSMSHSNVLGSTNHLSTPSNSVTNSVSSYRPRRKNTKPDLGFRPPVVNDESSVHFTDDGSERNSHRRKKDRQPGLINSIVIWLRNTNKMRYIQISKSFFKWKYTALYLTKSARSPRQLEEPTEASEAESEADDALHPSFIEQRNSYLQLFAENEKLREQVQEVKKVARQNEKTLKTQTMKTIFVVMLRKRLMTKLRYYYDLWLNNTRVIQIMNDIKHKQVELMVGLQQVESEREYVKQLEKTNSQLKMSLFLTIFFYQWKSKTSLLLLNSEREKYERQKSIIFQELMKIRKTVEEANHLESAEVKSSLMKGNQLQNQVTSIQGKLQSILQQNKQFRAQQQQQHHLLQMSLQSQISSPPPQPAQVPQHSPQPVLTSPHVKKIHSTIPFSSPPNFDDNSSVMSNNPVRPADANSVTNSSNATARKSSSGRKERNRNG